MSQFCHVYPDLCTERVVLPSWPGHLGNLSPFVVGKMEEGRVSAEARRTVLRLPGPSANSDPIPRTEASENRHQHDTLCFSLTVVKWIVVMPSLSRI